MTAHAMTNIPPTPHSGPESGHNERPARPGYCPACDGRLIPCRR